MVDAAQGCENNTESREKTLTPNQTAKLRWRRPKEFVGKGDGKALLLSCKWVKK
jgi:hypothetical protein